MNAVDREIIEEVYEYIRQFGPVHESEICEVFKYQKTIDYVDSLRMSKRIVWKDGGWKVPGADIPAVDKNTIVYADVANVLEDFLRRLG